MLSGLLICMGWALWEVQAVSQGTHTAQGKQGKWPQKNPSQGKHKFGIKKKNTGNLDFSSCKFPDSKGKRYFNICG